MPRLRVLLPVAFTLLANATPALAQTAPADAGPTIQWSAGWPRVGPGEIFATGTLAVASVALMLDLVPHGTGVSGPVLFDAAARHLAFGTAAGRRTARTASDVLKWIAILYPPVVDAALAAWGADQDSDVALQLIGIDALSYAATGVTIALAKNVVRRARPYAAECDRDPHYDPGCGTPDRFRSFPSGHSAFSFTGASLVCVAHSHLALYGGGAADDAACIGALAVAATTALLRVLADKHYATDVLAGAVVGVLSGFVLPSLLHFGFGGGHGPAPVP